MQKESVKWTESQRQVIESRGESLLVSAAAGSGKTAVLVERIISLVTDRKNPADIDRLLIMTFTNAAAAEMRERIGAALESLARACPDDEHLALQAALVHHAQITTIHSFCLNVVREHFNGLGLDPDFRIGDEGELLLMRRDVLAEMLEEHYRAAEPEFLDFVETFASGKKETVIEDYILSVYNFSQSNPWPQKWFAALKRQMRHAEGEEKAARADGPDGESRESCGEDEQPAYLAYLMEDIRRQAEELAEQTKEALTVIKSDPGLEPYETAYQDDYAQLHRLAAAADFKEQHAVLSAFSWTKCRSVRTKLLLDPEHREFVSQCRSRIKKAVGKLQKCCAFAAYGDLFAGMEQTFGPLLVLVELAQEFSARFAEKKREKNLLDFNDLEHEALRALTISDGADGIRYTEAADELAARFAAVLVDEYQDSNLVQEAILGAVCGERFGRFNRFMVGDVKQSIYKFRLARPELFLEKERCYEPYGTGAGHQKIIELQQNFRSRPAILNAVNDVFHRLMVKTLGGIQYTKKAALYPGAVFPEPSAEDAGRVFGEPELLLVDTGAAAAGEDEDSLDLTARQVEAHLVAAQIREMMEPGRERKIWDPKGKQYRPVSFRDMVVLLRAAEGWVQVFLEVFASEGIPAYADSRSGYFAATEVETALSILSVIDNPMQDIPLAAALKSPMGGLSDTELALVAAAWKKKAKKGQGCGLYAAVMNLVRGEALSDETEPDPSLEAVRQKLTRFAEQLEYFRRQSLILPIHELIHLVLEETGYYRLVQAMPGGQIRKANLDMLAEKAAAYNKTSYRGLFNFIRYIENLQKYKSDFGEARPLGEEDDTVRIMTIHNSKGLEFPVVFLAGAAKKFNRMDLSGRILIDADLGAASDWLDLSRRVKMPTLGRNAIKRKLEIDMLGEELRVLYVAMTRAKEALIITGADRSLESTLKKFRNLPAGGGVLPSTVIGSANSYLDWLLMAAGGGTRVRIRQVSYGSIVGREARAQAGTAFTRDVLMQDLRDYETAGAPGLAELKSRLLFSYPFAPDTALHAKMTVSGLKRQGQQEENEASVQFANFEGSGGAARGSAYHRALCLLPFDRMESPQETETFISQLAEQKKLSAQEAAFIRAEAVWDFLSSDIGKRLRLAQKDGRLFKERQFVIGLPADELGYTGSKELIIIQGVIDAYFAEPDGFVVVDYKTDRVTEKKTLIDRYERQLAYYGRALTQMTGLPVKERIIYSFALREEIYL